MFSALDPCLPSGTPPKQAMLRFDLPASAISAHVAALHRLTSSSGSAGAVKQADQSSIAPLDDWEEAGLGGGAVGTPKAWSMKMLEAAADNLRQALGQGGSGSERRRVSARMRK